MLSKAFTPISSLVPYIKAFWFVEGDVGNERMDYQLFADPLPELVFHYKNRFTGQEGPQPTVQLHGHTTAYESLSTIGSFGIFGVYLYPMALPVFFGLSAKELCSDSFSLTDVLGVSGRILTEQILGAKDNEERLLLATKFFVARLPRKPLDDRINHFLHYMALRKGQINIGTLADRHGLSLRQVERRFKEEIGFSPKLMARLMRFHHSINEGPKIKAPNMAQLALELGYSDQAHFSKEFKLFSGINPSSYFYTNITGSGNFIATT